MTDQPTPKPQSDDQAHAKLHELAALLRGAGHLEPSTQKALASLLDELGEELDSTSLASANTARLADAVNEVARSLHEQHPAGIVATARDRLKEAATRAEVESPVASGVVYRLIDLLSSMGI